MFNALSRLCLKAIVFGLQVLLPLAQFVGFDVHLSPPTIQVLSIESALTTKQKYLHTVDSPSFCIVLNSPDDSLFLNLFPDTSLPPVIALSQLGHKKNPRTQEGYYPKCDLFYSQKRTSPSREADTLT